MKFMLQFTRKTCSKKKFWYLVVGIMVLVLFHDMAKIDFFFISTAAPVKNNMFCKSLTVTRYAKNGARYFSIHHLAMNVNFFLFEPDFKNMYAIGRQ